MSGCISGGIVGDVTGGITGGIVGCRQKETGEVFDWEGKSPIAWFDPSFGITKDGSDKVSAWASRIGSETVTQTVGSQQPTWKDTDPESQLSAGTQYLLFDDTGDECLDGASFPDVTNGAFLILLRSHVSAGTRVALSHWDFAQTSPAGQRWYWRQSGDDAQVQFYNDAGALRGLSLADELTPLEPEIFGAIIKDGQQSHGVDGAATATNTEGFPHSSSTSCGLGIGHRRGQSTWTWDGKILDIVIWDDATIDAAYLGRRATELKTRYGL